MALPSTITANAQPGGYSPPFKSSGGNFYVLAFVGGTGDLAAFKTSDPTGTWTEQDSSNRYSSANFDAKDSFAVYQDGDALHIALNTGGNGLDYARFNMNTDTWVSGSPVGTVASVCSAFQLDSVGITVDSSGNIYIIYNGAEDKVKGTNYGRVDYARWNGSSWSPDNALDAAGEVSYGICGAALSKGGTNDVHLTWLKYSGVIAASGTVTFTAIEGRTYDASTGLTATVGGGPTLADVRRHASGKLLTWTDGSTERIGFIVEVGGQLDLVHTTEDGSGHIQAYNASAVSVADNDAYLETVSSVDYWYPYGVAENSNTLYLMYSGGGTAGVDQDLYYTKSSNAAATTWDSDTENKNAITADTVHINVYTRSGTKLAYVYDDGGTLKYDEVSLGGSVTNEVTITGANNYAVTTDTDVQLRKRTRQQSDVELSNLVTDALQSYKLTNRSLSDSIAITDADVSYKESRRTPADSVEVIDVSIKLRERNNALADTLATADTEALLRERNRSQSDSITVEDVNSQWIENNQEQVETIDVADDAVEARERNRAQSDSVTSIDVDIQLRLRNRLLSDSIVVLDDKTATYVPGGQVVNEVTLQDLNSCAVTDNTIQLRLRDREQTEYFPVHGDALIFDNVFSKAQRIRDRSQSDSLAVEDVNAQWIENNQALVETIDSADDSVEERERNRTLAESITVLDDKTATYIPPGSVTYDRTLQDLDSCTVTDDAIELRLRDRESLDSAVITDDKTATYIPVGTVINEVTLQDLDSVAVNDINEQLRERARAAGETAPITDATAEYRERNRAATDDLATSDTSGAEAIRARQLSDGLDLSETIETVRERLRALSDNIDITDSIIVTTDQQVTTRTLTDTLVVEDNIVATYSFVVPDFRIKVGLELFDVNIGLESAVHAIHRIRKETS